MSLFKNDSYVHKTNDFRIKSVCAKHLNHTILCLRLSSVHFVGRRVSVRFGQKFWPNQTFFFYWIRPLAESYNFKILYSAIKLFFLFFRPRFFLNMIRPKNKIYDLAKRILFLATPMEKAGILKKLYMRFL